MLRRPLRFLISFAISLGISLTVTYLVAIRPLWKHWGVDPLEVERPLPGDDLVPEPSATDTRGITIAAPPSAVWPWLLQMGYERAGWYSYDAVDMAKKSAGEIHPEWQSLAVGDIVPTDPRGGFLVKALEPEKSLVLFYDTTLMKEQFATAAEADVPGTPANLRATGKALGTMTPPEFSISWAFVLEPTVEGGSRLIERFRLAGDMPGRAAPIAGKMLGLGIFTMARKQMLGIQMRAERVARESLALSSFATTLGHQPAEAAVSQPSAPEATPTQPALHETSTHEHAAKHEDLAKQEHAAKHEEPEIRVRVKVSDTEVKPTEAPQPTPPGTKPEPVTPEPTETEPVKA